MQKIIIGIIDDDPTKVTQLLTYLKLGWKDENDNLLKEKYKDVYLCPLEISIENNLDQMVEKIFESKPDVLIIDYKLSSQKSIAYTGVSLAQALDNIMREFPIFILTTYQDDLFDKECFDVYQVFDFERYIKDDDERLELNSKLVEQFRNYRITLEKWHKELIKLLPQAGASAEIDQRIIELDSNIEKSINGSSIIPEKTKVELSTNHLQTLIEKINLILKED